MTSYTLTPADFARDRARLSERREAIKARHLEEMSSVKAELDALDDLEKAVIEMAARSAAGTPARKKTRKETKPNSAAPLTGHRQKYTAEQDAELLDTPIKKGVRELAKRWGRSFEGVEKRREVLLKQQRASGEQPVPAPEPESRAAKRSEEAADGGQALDTGEALRPVDGAESGLAARRSADVAGAGPADSRERPAPHPAPAAAAQLDNPEVMQWIASARNRPRPGKPVYGLTDDGPEHQRRLDPTSFSSPGRDG